MMPLGILIAVLLTDATPHEQRLLIRIAELESGGWNTDVINCRKFGRIGERSAWQIVPRDRTEYVETCASYAGAASIALERVRESIAKCGDLTGYVSGKCGRGVREARARWVE